MGQVDCGLFVDGGTERHSGALPSATTSLVSIREEVEYGQAGKVGAVPEGLYTGDGPLPI